MLLDVLVVLVGNDLGGVVVCGISDVIDSAYTCGLVTLFQLHHLVGSLTRVIVCLALKFRLVEGTVVLNGLRSIDVPVCDDIVDLILLVNVLLLNGMLS